MTNNKAFYNQKKKLFQTLSQYVPIVDRVHGGSHPEFHQVRELFDIILEKTKDAGAAHPKLDVEFVKLREITNNYTIPSGVCESYEAVYKMLAEIDKAYAE